MLFACALVSAQDTADFAKWKESHKEQYQQFRDTLSQEYSAFLNQHWEEFRLFQADHRHGLKPSVQPVQLDPDTISLQEESFQIIADTTTDEDTLSPHPGAVSYRAEIVTFRFYCKDVVFKIPVGMSKLSLQSPRERQVAHYWKSLSLLDLNNLVYQIRQQRNAMYLNGWGLLDLVQHLSRNIYPASTYAQTAWTTYMMNRMGYDVRLGRQGDHLVLLCTTNHPVYDCPYLLIEDKKYYALSELSSANARLSTYPNQQQGATVPISLDLKYSPRIGGCLASTPYRRSYQGQNMKIPVNKALVDFFSTYPQTELSVYANAAVEEAMSLSMVEAFRPLVAQQTSEKAISQLMIFFQEEFVYRTDKEQFGREKSFFCEENFFYPANDCEDRAILFAHLVQTLLGLDVVLLEFSDHVATAVDFGSAKVKGVYYQHNGHRYVVCDPTTRGAGIGQLMRKYRKQKPNMIIN